MLRKKTFVLFVLLSCFSVIQTSVFAQKSTAKVSIEPFEIVIGQQATINLEVISPKGRDIILPVYVDTLVTGIEVLATSPIDTTYANDLMTISQKYIVTSFDSALYHIPYIPVIDGKDTLRSNDFALKVVSPDLSDATLDYLKQWNEQPTDSIDVSQLGINDIKPILKPPFVWQDYLNYIIVGWLIIIVLALIGAVIYIYLRKKKKGYFFKPEVILPPHVIALTALDHVKDEKLWQRGREKEYYTNLTDILRKYIGDRFNTNAFEMTSDEILSAIKNYTEADSAPQGLNQVLKLSDLVKFAKYKPLADENDLSLVNAYLFVNQTKKEEEVISDENDSIENNSPENNDKKINRTVPSNNNTTTSK